MHNVFSALGGPASPFGRRGGGAPPAPAFTPSTLYSSGAQGIWLDPSDLSTMFSDRAGTTPVTTPGTVVGLRLDKSKGLVLGPELVVNGDFDGGTTTGWTNVGGSISVVGGRLRIVSAGSNATAVQSVSTEVGKTYEIRIDGYNETGAFGLRVGTTSGGTDLFTAGPSVGYRRYFAALSTTTFVAIRNTTTTVGAYVETDNISVRELPGNHAAAPTDAARPIYGVEPKGGRRNLLTWSEDFRNTAAAGETRPWAWSNATVTANTTAAPDGTITADTINASLAGHVISRAFTATAAIYTASVYFRQGTDTAFELQFNTASFALGVRLRYTFSTATTTVTLGGSPSNVTTNVVAVDGVWFRATVSVLCTAATWYLDVHGITASQTSIVWGAQLELGATAGAYQKVTTDYDITESGVPTCHYVQFDGSDDSMSTAAIDFTGTDKMSVFAGVRKLSDAAAVLLENSTNAAFNNGAFYVVTGSDSGGVYSSLSKGTATVSASQTAIWTTGGTAPDAAVITATHDISGDLSAIRRNGVAGSSGTGDKGAGNFGNYPLYIGRRGSSSSPFNGRDYGIVIVGKTASAGEITDTELWLSDKTSEVDVAKSISPNIYTRSGDTILDRANSIIERRTV